MSAAVLVVAEILLASLVRLVDGSPDRAAHVPKSVFGLDKKLAIHRSATCSVAQTKPSVVGMLKPESQRRAGLKNSFVLVFFLLIASVRLLSVRLVPVTTTALFGITAQLHCAMFNRPLKEERRYS